MQAPVFKRRWQKASEPRGCKYRITAYLEVLSLQIFPILGLFGVLGKLEVFMLALQTNTKHRPGVDDAFRLLNHDLPLS